MNSWTAHWTAHWIQIHGHLNVSGPEVGQSHRLHCEKAQQRLFFLRQLRKFNLSQELLKQFYSAIIESVLCMSITVWFSSATKSDLRKLRRVVWTAERVIGTTLPYSPRTVLIQSEKKGWQNHSEPLISSTLPLWTVTVWSMLQSSVKVYVIIKIMLKIITENNACFCIKHSTGYENHKHVMWCMKRPLNVS